MTEDWRDRNRRSWDERVPIHVASEFYDVEGFKAGASCLSPEEVEDLSPVTGRRLVHLQCHFGLDTLSWARLGADVTGLDFSEPAIDTARRLADRIGVDARFICADVYDAPAALGAQYDIVYTGLGALNWLPDIGRWAQVVAELLETGGELYLIEYHPLTWIFADDGPDIAYDYFMPDGFVGDETSTYADGTAELQNTGTVEWNHGLGDVVTAVTAAGLEIVSLREWDRSFRYRRWPMMEPDGHGSFTMPSRHPNLPLSYTLRAKKPA